MVQRIVSGDPEQLLYGVSHLSVTRDYRTATHLPIGDSEIPERLHSFVANGVANPSLSRVGCELLRPRNIGTNFVGYTQRSCCALPSYFAPVDIECDRFEVV